MDQEHFVNTPLILSAADQENVQSAIREMLTCGIHPTLSDWRISIHRAVKRVLDADMVMSYVGTHQFDCLLSQEITRIREFPYQVESLIKRFDAFRRAETMGAWSRSGLWGQNLDYFRRSAYYNEFARPLGSIDGAGLAVVVGGVHAGMQLHRDSELAGGLSERHVALVSLLRPAFEVGIAMALMHFGLPHSGDQHATLAGAPSVLPESHFASQRVGTTLTPREFEVAFLLASRRSNREIADTLHMSPSTAKRHTENILLKLGLRSRREVERVLDYV
jgi:DNA-binding CsgD family transcriptional regulator